MSKRNLVVLTGAGISAESGVPTFRAADGLWLGHRVEDVATPEAFQRDPALVQDFYNQRRRQLATVHPNAAHRALAELAARWEGDFLLVTQNVDDLHDRAHEDTPPGPGFELSQCDLFLSIGTSGAVWPAAGFVQAARMAGARTVEINLEPTAGRRLFEDGVYGPASETLPRFLKDL